jgi:H+/Cl- antiporter ClcA
MQGYWRICVKDYLSATSKKCSPKQTLMGMAGALVVFFGVPIGGSLFALEVCS